MGLLQLYSADKIGKDAQKLGKLQQNRTDFTFFLMDWEDI